MGPIEKSSSLFKEKKQLGSQDGVNIEEEESRDLEYHPLLNNVILSLVFKSVRRKDLTSCRLVCKQWNVMTLPFIRSEFWVSIYVENTIPSNEDNDITNTNRIQNFLKTFKSVTLGIPFSKFRLGSFCTTEGDGQEFLQLCGNTTKAVLLNHPEFTIEDVSELLKCMPNLESLSIEDYPRPKFSSNGNTVKLFPDSMTRLIRLKKLRLRLYMNESNEERRKLCPTFIQELLSVAPNISDFDISYSNNNNEDPLRIDIGIVVLDAIEELHMESSIHKLTLSCLKNVYVESLRRMALNGLKLKHLTFYTTESKSSHDFHTVVTLFKDTLETLELKDSDCCANMNEFPKMSRLTKLHVKIPTGHYSNVKLNRIFPALMELKLCSPYYRDEVEEGANEFFPGSDPCQNITTFHVSGLGIPLNLRTLDRIQTIFPKLTELSLSLTFIKENVVEMLRKIWGDMTQLESLSITVNSEAIDSMDSVITGIPAHVIQEIVPEVNALTQMTRELRAETIKRLRDQYCQFPNIANLRNLRRLCTSMFPERQENDGTDQTSHKNCMTDVSAYLGLYSMRNLNRLTILSCEITHSCCEVLAKDLELEHGFFAAPHFRQYYAYKE